MGGIVMQKSREIHKKIIAGIIKGLVEEKIERDTIERDEIRLCGCCKNGDSLEPCANPCCGEEKLFFKEEKDCSYFERDNSSIDLERQVRKDEWERNQKEVSPEGVKAGLKYLASILSEIADEQK